MSARGPNAETCFLLTGEYPGEIAERALERAKNLTYEEVARTNALLQRDRTCISCGSATQPCCGH